jgi:glycosyltransferase involved in cell wall biosynthesis
MRILFLSTTFPDAASPARGTYNAALCQALARDHAVRVIAPRTFTEAYRLSGLQRQFRTPHELAQAGVDAAYPTYWYTPKVLQHRYGAQMWRSVQRCVRRAIQDFRPDAVLSYWAHPDGEAGLRAAELAGVPSAVIVGGTDVLILPHLARRGEPVKHVLNHSSAVVCVSEGLRRAGIELGVSPARMHTIYQGIDASRFHPGAGRAAARRKLNLTEGVAHFVWVGRMVPIKALEVLLDAAALLRKRGVPFQLHLLGDGPAKAAAQRHAASQELESQVTFHGAAGHDVIPDWYRAADVTVLSSDSEGLPNVLRESLACGTPFVSTDVGSVREIARPDYAALAPPRQSAAFADAIQAMLHPDCRDAAAAYQARTWRDCARDVARLLETLRGEAAAPAKLSPRPTGKNLQRI